MIRPEDIEFHFIPFPQFRWWQLRARFGWWRWRRSHARERAAMHPDMRAAYDDMQKDVERRLFLGDGV
jgi:hypothetical protein